MEFTMSILKSTYMFFLGSLKINSASMFVVAFIKFLGGKMYNTILIVIVTRLCMYIYFWYPKLKLWLWGKLVSLISEIYISTYSIYSSSDTTTNKELWISNNSFAVKENHTNLKKDILYRNSLKMPVELDILCFLAVYHSFLFLKSKFRFIGLEEIFFLLHISLILNIFLLIPRLFIGTLPCSWLECLMRS